MLGLFFFFSRQAGEDALQGPVETGRVDDAYWESDGPIQFEDAVTENENYQDGCQAENSLNGWGITIADTLLVDNFKTQHQNQEDTIDYIPYWKDELPIINAAVF